MSLSKLFLVHVMSFGLKSAPGTFIGRFAALWLAYGIERNMFDYHTFQTENSNGADQIALICRVDSERTV